MGSGRDRAETREGRRARGHRRGTVLAAVLAAVLMAPVAAAAQVPNPVQAPATSAVVFAAATPTIVVRTPVSLPVQWKLRTKSQVKVVRPAGVTRCTKSRWQSSRVAGRRAYVAMTLTCRVRADGAARTVTLVNAKRRAQRLGVQVVVAPPTTTIAPPAPPPASAPPATAPAVPRARSLGNAADFTYLATQPRNPSLPVTWDHCQPIDVAVNLADAPAEELVLVTEAIRQVAMASGLPLQFAGATTYVPDANAGQWPAGVEIAFSMSRAGQSSYLDGRSAGSGGMSYSGGDLMWALSGQVVIDWQVTGPLSGGATGFRSSIYMHELAHAVGLGHAAGAEQLMAPTISDQNVGAWGNGDLAGLASLGSQPCRTA